MLTSDACAPLGPRPWYVSVTLLWRELDNFSALRRAIELFRKRRQLPVHHVAVYPESWHSTILAVFQINRVPASNDAFEGFADSLFKQLTDYGELRRGLKSTLKPVTFVAHQVRCFDDGTTIQFQDSEDLKQLRTDLRDLFRPYVGALVGSTVSAYGTPARGGLRPIVESLLDHQTKSSGKRLFGSFARSSCRADSSVLRWEEQIRPLQLRCNRFHLLVSDDVLANPRRLDQNDLLFPTTDSTRRRVSR